MNSFVAIDFETANFDYSSICQVGIVCFDNGSITKSINQLIDPEDYFSGFHINKHKIQPTDVEGMPTFEEYFPELVEIINNNIIVHHQPFDKCAFDQACEKYSLDPPLCYWLDNAKIVKRTWPERAKKGYGLKETAKMLNIFFKHHDAEEDAKAAGLILIEACKCNGLNIHELITNVYEKRIYNKSTKHPQRLTGDVLKPDLNKVENTNNPFYNKKVVISGTYQTWPDRTDLAKIIKNLGADIDSSVSKRTNILCAGMGVGPSKISKMQQNIDDGCDAVILYEKEILELLNRCK